MIIGYWVYAEDDENCAKDQSFTRLKEAYKYYVSLGKQFKRCVLSLCQYSTIRDFIEDRDLKHEEILFNQTGGLK